METAREARRIEITRRLSEAVEQISAALWTGRLGFDYAIKEYVQKEDNELSQALVKYVEALGLGDETERATTEAEDEHNAEIRRTILLEVARRFDVPEVTAFVKVVLESLYYRKSIVLTVLDQAELLRRRLAAIEQGAADAEYWISRLGPLGFIYADPTVMEIVVDAPDRVRVMRSQSAHTLADVEVNLSTQDELRRVIDGLMSFGAVSLGKENTIGEVHLPDGSRALAVVPPTAIGSPYLFIEKVDPEKFSFSWERLLKIGSISSEAHELLMTAIQRHGPAANILVVGDTRNAKNYLLNLLAESLPPEERVIVVADSFLLPVARHPRRIHLEPGNTPQTAARQLLDVAARMHPDWLVTGDLQGPEAMTLIQLMNSGYHVLTTLCAQSPLDALAQLETMCLSGNPNLGLVEIRPTIAAALPLIVFMKSYALPDHRIKITQLVEVCGVENDRYVLQPLFLYDNVEGVLHPTQAGKTWAERAHSRMITG